MDAEHHGFGFRVAHAHIVFYHHRIAFHIYQAQEYETAIGDALLAETVDGGLDDAVVHLSHKCIVGEADGRDGTHASGVEPGVAFANALIVLSHGEHLIVIAVGEHKHRALYSRKKFFDNHSAARSTEHAVEHLAEFFLSLVEVGDNEHALTGSQAVGFEHIRSL